jgi:transcriptional regulator ATRX
MKSPCIVYDFSEVQAFARDSVLNNWTTWGGILIISPGTLVSHMKDIKKCSDKLIECDMVVVDEGHLCLKSTTTLQAKKLDEIKTKRRIVLTGTPLSNNLLEYYNVASYVQPGCLGKEAEFEREFKDPIEKGMASDVSPSAALLSQQKSAELHQKLAAIVNRKDASVLRQVLPPLQQVVLHVRPTRVQSQIYNEYKKFQRRKDSKNFFKAYQVRNE